MIFDKDDNIIQEGKFKNGKGKLYFNDLLINVKEEERPFQKMVIIILEK